MLGPKKQKTEAGIPEPLRPAAPVLALRLPGCHPAHFRPDWLPPADIEANFKEKMGWRSKMAERGTLAGEGTFSSCALSRWFGVPREHVLPNLSPYPTPSTPGSSKV